MIYSIYPIKDSCIYEGDIYQNSGLDSIVELEKIVSSSEEASTVNSRILMKYDLTDINSMISTGKITNPKFYLNLYTCEVEDLPLSYTVEVVTVSGSWEMGVGKRGDNPYNGEGVSWLYRDSEALKTTWITASLPEGVEEYHTSEYGGGNWYTSSLYKATQSFSTETTDLRVDVTNIVMAWISESIGNDGFLIKRTNAEESNSSEMGTLKFFSRETNTVYAPKLEVAWDDSSYISGSLSLLSEDDNYIVYSSNLLSTYNEKSKNKIRIIGRKRFPTKTFATASDYTSVSYRLPESTYYSIKDLHTEETVVPYDTSYTKVSCDSNGNYIRLWMDAFQPERYYKILLKVIYNNDEKYIDDKLIFKVVR